jgi:peptidoglycan/LPS O-acetylase OafA/YrhL
MGKYSYGLYVLHVPVIWFLGTKIGLQTDFFPRLWGSSLPGAFVFCMIGGGISVLCAMASYHLYEAPFLRLKQYLPYRTTGADHTEAEQAVPKARLLSPLAARAHIASVSLAAVMSSVADLSNADNKTMQDEHEIVEKQHPNATGPR